MDTGRLLVISHNSFGRENNMGKTLEMLFAGWPADKIAQLYFSDNLPCSDICHRYYRITDFDVLKTLLGKRKCGAAVRCTQEQRKRSRIKQTIISEGKKRTSPIYSARNMIWNMGRWKGKDLQRWLDAFSPEAVFFASGDYSFSYKVALQIAEERNIPLYLYCCDDFYLGGYRATGVWGKINYKSFMKVVHKTFEYATDYFCICDEMVQAYEQYFGRRGKVVHTGASDGIDPSIPVNERKKEVFYAGNLDCGRAEQLVKLGRILRDLGTDRIHVYSGETREELTGLMCAENGIIFHGFVSETEINRLLQTSMFTLHIESFDEKMIPRVKYSVSTKIANALAGGICLIAVGPEDVASIRYLAQYGAACIIDNENHMEKQLRQIMDDGRLRSNIVGNAIELAKKNHDPSKSRQIILNTIHGSGGTET